MVIGAFFSEVGTELLKMLSTFDSCASEITKELVVNARWSDRDFRKIYINDRIWVHIICCKGNNA